MYASGHPRQVADHRKVIDRDRAMLPEAGNEYRYAQKKMMITEAQHSLFNIGIPKIDLQFRNPNFRAGPSVDRVLRD